MSRSEEMLEKTTVFKTNPQVLMNKKTLVISSGLVHPNLICRQSLKHLLREKKETLFTFSSSLDSLLRISTEETSTVILYFQKKQISDPLLQALERFVFNGGGLLALHAASASFKRNNRYFKLIGGRFLRHGAVSEFKIDAATNRSEIYKNIPGFTITDELYIHDYLRDVTVHFSTTVAEKTEPVVWTRELGKGRIAYCSLGHRSAVWKHPQVKAIVHQSLDWLKNAG